MQFVRFPGYERLPRYKFLSRYSCVEGSLDHKMGCSVTLHRCDQLSGMKLTTLLSSTAEKAYCDKIDNFVFAVLDDFNKSNYLSNLKCIKTQ